MGLRERVAAADWAELGVDYRAEAEHRARVAYVASLDRAEPSTEVLLRYCPTCGQALELCSTPWADGPVDPPVLCRLPRGHRSEEHWHPPLGPGTADVLWWDEPEPEPDLEGE